MEKPAEKEGASELRLEAAVDEATQSAADQLKRQRQEMRVQKHPDRPPMFSDGARLEVDKDGKSGYDRRPALRPKVMTRRDKT